MKLLNTFLLLVTIALFFSDAYCQQMNIEVKRVIDGDTIEVVYLGNKQTIRLSYIDAPEYNEPYGEESYQYLKQRVLNKKVIINSQNIGKYKRLIGEVFLDLQKASINQELLFYGFAKCLSKCRVEELVHERSAQANLRGLWKESFAHRKESQSVEVKKSRSGICHKKSSSYYKKTKLFKGFNSMSSCIASGGRRAKSW